MKRNCKLHSNQKGLATLFTAIFLLLVSTILVFAVARSTVSGQKNVGDELRITEAYQAAEAGLEFGMSEMKTNFAGLAIGDNAGDTAASTLQDVSPDGSGNIYDVTVTYTRLVEADPAANRDNPIFQVDANAVPDGGETQISRTVSTLVLRADTFGSIPGGASPILLEGSMTNTTGTGDVVPGANGVAVTSLGDSGTESIDLVESNPSAAEAHGGSSTYSDGQTSLAQAIFGTNLTGADLDALVKELAEDNPNIHYYDTAPNNIPDYPSNFDDPSKLASLNGNPPEIDIDDSSNYHLVYFATEDANGDPICPKLNGGFHLIGMIYVGSEGGSGAGQCDSMGFGNCHIYGTLAFTGDLNKFNANCQVIGLDLSAAGDGGFFNSASLSPIPGTWRDFQ